MAKKNSLSQEQINKIWEVRPDIKTTYSNKKNWTSGNKSAAEQTSHWWDVLGAQNLGADFFTKSAAPTAAPMATPAAAPAPAAPAAAPVDPYAFLTSAATATKTLDQILGITDVQTQISGIDTTIADKKSKLNEALGTVNENPWLAEASRIGRSKRLQEMSGLDIGNYLEQRNQLNDKLGYLTTKAGNVISLGTSQQQNQLQKQQMATSSAEFASNMELEKAKMNQNQEQFDANLAFDSLKFQKELGLKKKDADALAKQYNTDLKYKYAALAASTSTDQANTAQNAAEFDWKKIYDTSYLEHLKNTEKSGGSFGDL